jgi:hypothetical protein
MIDQLGSATLLLEMGSGKSNGSNNWNTEDRSVPIKALRFVDYDNKLYTNSPLKRKNYKH